MDSLSSSASTVPSIDDYFEHNVWNPVLEMLFLEQVSGIFASYLVEIDLAKIALSCHFALDLLCYKRCLCTIHGAPLPMEFLMFLWHHCHPRVVSVLCLARRYTFLCHISLLPLAGAISSMFPYPYVALV